MSEGGCPHSPPGGIDIMIGPLHRIDCSSAFAQPEGLAFCTLCLKHLLAHASMALLYVQHGQLAACERARMQLAGVCGWSH